MRADRTGPVEVHQQDAFPLTGLGEGVRQRGPAIPDPLGHGLRPVQVAQRDVVEPVEDVGGDRLHSPDRDRTFRPAGDRADHEGMRQHHRPGPRGSTGEVAAGLRHGAGQHLLVAARGRQIPRAAHQIRFEIGHGIKGDGAVRVGQQHRLARPPGGGPQVQPAGREKFGERAEPRRGVVVAGDRHDGDPGGADPAQDPGGALHRLRGRHRPVVQVARDEHDVHLVRGGEIGHRTQHRFLVGQQALAMEGPTEVPVGGVHHAHGVTVGGGSDSHRDQHSERAGQ